MLVVTQQSYCTLNAQLGRLVWSGLYAPQIPTEIMFLEIAIQSVFLTFHPQHGSEWKSRALILWMRSWRKCLQVLYSVSVYSCVILGIEYLYPSKRAIKEPFEFDTPRKTNLIFWALPKYSKGWGRETPKRCDWSESIWIVRKWVSNHVLKYIYPVWITVWENSAVGACTICSAGFLGNIEGKETSFQRWNMNSK